jgi:hypothetical protein
MAQIWMNCTWDAIRVIMCMKILWTIREIQNSIYREPETHIILLSVTIFFGVKFECKKLSMTLNDLNKYLLIFLPYMLLDGLGYQWCSFLMNTCFNLRVCAHISHQTLTTFDFPLYYYRVYDSCTNCITRLSINVLIFVLLQVIQTWSWLLLATNLIWKTKERWQPK